MRDPEWPESSKPQSADLNLPHRADLDPQFKAQIQRLHELTVWGRWLVVTGLWLSVGAFSLWEFRYPLALMQEYFTWAALRYGLVYHPLAAIGLGLCIGMTLSVLIWQSRNILFGLPKAEYKRLESKVLKMRQQGNSHPLWKWVDRAS